jgi:hypothetical protein
LRLSARPVVLGAATALIAASPALGATPAQQLAATLRPSMVRYYATHDPGLEITAVTCSLDAAETRARCAARFTVSVERMTGVFGVDATIDRTTGTATTRTVSDTCRSVKTHKRVTCVL